MSFRTYAKQVSPELDAFVVNRLDYDPETGLFRWKNSKRRGVNGRVAGCKSVFGYMVLKHRNQNFTLHRAAWRLHYGKWPELVIDHINGDRTDNRISNLREVTQQINTQNRHRVSSRSKTGLLGVLVDGTGYQARIRLDGKSVYLGYFRDPNEAAAAYQKASALRQAQHS